MPRSIPDDNLAYPVYLVVDGRPVGSGFYLNTGRSSFLVTARHVLFDEQTKGRVGKQCSASSQPADPAAGGRNELALDLEHLENAGNLRAHLSADVAVARILQGAAGHSTPLPGVTFVSLVAPGIVGVDYKSVKKFADVLVGNDVFLLGYPRSIGLQQIPQLDYDRPLLRKGIVAGTNPGAKKLVLDCPAYGGNSGGPVLETETVTGAVYFRVFGVVVQFVPFAAPLPPPFNAMVTNSGYSIAEPIDPVLELVEAIEGP